MNQLALPTTAPVGAYIEAEALGARLGFARPRAARDLARKLLKNGIMNDFDVCREHGKPAAVGGRPADLLWLTVSGALVVAAHARTPRAAEVHAKLMARAVPPTPSPDIAALVAEVQALRELLATTRKPLDTAAHVAADRSFVVDVLVELRALRASQDGARVELQALRDEVARRNAPTPLRPSVAPVFPQAPTARPAEPTAPTPLPPLFPRQRDPFEVFYEAIRPIFDDPVRRRGLTAAELLEHFDERLREGLAHLAPRLAPRRSPPVRPEAPEASEPLPRGRHAQRGGYLQPAHLESREYPGRGTTVTRRPARCARSTISPVPVFLQPLGSHERPGPGFSSRPNANTRVGFPSASMR